MRNKERISRLLGPVGPRMWSGYWGSAASSLFHHTAIRGVQGRAVAKVSKGAVTPAKTECPRHVTCKVLAWLDSEVDVSSWKLACLEWKRCLQLQLDDIPGTWYLWRFVAKKWFYSNVRMQDFTPLHNYQPTHKNLPLKGRGSFTCPPFKSVTLGFCVCCWRAIC